MNKGKPSSMTPIGMKVAKGPAKVEATKVTDNNRGWAEVANIPVPPAAERRDFNKPLNQTPFLVNGGLLQPGKSSDQLLPTSEELEGPEEIKSSSGPSFTYENPMIESSAKPIIVEIVWHGARMAVPCLNAVYQPADIKRGIEGWLMLEFSVANKSKMPLWTPPIAQLNENGTIYVPEFDCRLNNQLLKCQVLNIDLHDELNQKRIFVFRVLEFTKYSNEF